MKPPAKKEPPNNQSFPYVDGYNEGIQVERDWWNKHIDEAEIESKIKSFYETNKKANVMMSIELTSKCIAGIVRELLKGQ